jgi:hypothetical protein
MPPLSDYFNIPEVRKALHVPDYIPPFEIYNEKITIYYQWNKEGSGIIN